MEGWRVCMWCSGSGGDWTDGGGDIISFSLKNIFIFGDVNLISMTLDGETFLSGIKNLQNTWPQCWWDFFM